MAWVWLSGSGASGKTNPHSTRESAIRTWTQKKKEQLSSRKPLHVLFFFVPGLRPQARFGAQSSEARLLARRSAHFFFSRERKRNVGRNRSFLFQEDQTRFTMRINTELLEQIKAEAEKNKRSAAKEIEYILEQYIKRLSEWKPLFST